MVEHRKTMVSAALTSVSESVASTMTIQGSPGAIYTLKRVEIQYFPVVTTVVNNGARLRLINDSIDWQPFEVYTTATTTVGAGAGGCVLEPTKINCNVPLPAGSTISGYFTPYATASQVIAVTVVYEKRQFSGKQTFFLGSLGTAVTQVTISATHNTFTIPATKGGNAISLNIVCLGTIETVVCSGGLIAVRSQNMIPEAIEPMEDYISGITSVTLGGGVIPLKEIPLGGYILADRAVIEVDYTPQDNQSQRLAAFLAWER